MFNLAVDKGWVAGLASVDALKVTKANKSDLKKKVNKSELQKLLSISDLKEMTKKTDLMEMI